MARTIDEDGNETGSISERKEKRRLASLQGDGFGTPDNIREANKRLSGPGPHSTKDKRDVLLYYNKKQKKGKV